MRVLTFLHSFEPGGVERDALRLNAEWARLGVDVQIALGRRDGRLADEAPDLPYTVLQTGRISTAAFETLWMIFKLPGLVRRLKPDILFCAGNTYSIVAVTTRLLLGRACPPIVLKVSNDLERRDLPAPMRWAYHLWLRIQRKAFDAAVAMAEPMVPEIARHMDHNGLRLTVIHNPSIRAAETASLAETRTTTTRTRKGRHFLAIGRLVAQKNFALLIAAFDRIATPEDRLLIVGEGGLRGSLQSLIKTLGRSDQITLPGHKHPLFIEFANADAFILSSDYEGVPAVIVEALAAGIPIVATDCCASMSFLVSDAGLIVPANAVSALSEAMDTIDQTSIDVSAMQKRAATFTVETVAGRWRDLFASIAQVMPGQVTKIGGAPLANPAFGPQHPEKR